MDSKTAEYLSKLMLENDEDDIVSFCFPNQKRKIKCSISMLTEISPVFEAMFSTRWCHEEEVDDNQLTVDAVSKDKTIELSDDVTFDQYLTFKLLMQIMYGLREPNSLTVDQATNVYYYSDKYQIKEVSDKVQKFLNQRMQSGISTHPLTVAEPAESITFAQLHKLADFKSKLDEVKLAFDEHNTIQFWDLTVKFEMKKLQEQVLDHLKTVAPKNDYPPDLLIALVSDLQANKKEIEKALEGKTALVSYLQANKKEIKKALKGVTSYCQRPNPYCDNCGHQF